MWSSDAASSSKGGLDDSYDDDLHKAEHGTGQAASLLLIAF